jgi:FAD:protein FMN transferase
MHRYVLPLACCVAFACSKEYRQPFVRETAAMNTYLRVTVYDQAISPEDASAAIDSAIGEVRRIESIATDYSDSSEIGRMNDAAGRDSVEASADLLDLLKRALTYASVSHGAFDPAIGPVVKAWDFLSEHPRVPPAGTIARLEKLVDFHGIGIVGRKVVLHREGMAIDLGAIAKGFAVDKATAALERNGVHECIVDLGGNLGVAWPGTTMLDSSAATIYIRDPRHDGEYFGRFQCGTAGISTSGDYQRFFIEQGVRYHHIIDPATGYPARGAVSVTVIAPNATDADALSTLVFVLGKDRGLEYLKSLPGVEGLIVAEQGDSLVYGATKHFAERFTRLHEGEE